MAEMYAVIFDGDEYCQFKLSDMLAHSINGFLYEEFSNQRIGIYLPVAEELGEFVIDNLRKDWKFVLNGKTIEKKEAIQHGDFLALMNKEKEISVLFLDFSECSYHSKIYGLDNKQEISIGRNEESKIILDYTKAVSRNHAKIYAKDTGEFYVSDISNTTGVFVNGYRIKEKKLEFGDKVYIMGTTMIYMNGLIIMPDRVPVNGLSEALLDMESECNVVRREFSRNPRVLLPIERETIEIDDPTPEQKYAELPFVLAAGPSLTMSAAMLVSLGVSVSKVINSPSGDYASVIPSGVMAVSMLLGALLWPKLSRSYYKRIAVEKEEYRKKRYTEYLEEKELKISSAYQKNTRIWVEELYPNVEVLSENTEKQNERLWERSHTERDFLTVRLGLGTRPFETQIVVKKRGFELEDDELKTKADKIAEKYRELIDVPITISLLNNRTIGVYGNYWATIWNILANLVALYSPDEVKLVLLFNKYQAKRLEIFDNIPHVWSADKKNRYIATTHDEAMVLFENLREILHERLESEESNRETIPHYVIFAFDQDLINDISFKKVLLSDDANGLGVSVLFIDEKFNRIPQECSALIESGTETGGLYIRKNEEITYSQYVFDGDTEKNLKRLVDSLAQVKIKHEVKAASIPERVNFLDLYKAGNVEALRIAGNWMNSSTEKSMAAPIGFMAGGEMFALDIHEKHHGCHGLVAGTTGSGKSEFLQSYILSMMIKYSPEDIAFVLVDFKGGDMARPFLKSPHLAATVSNLSGHMLYRALVSLEAEVRNRQSKLNKAAAALGTDKIDINSYQKFYKEHKIQEPLPHLIIIIDEFAQLKKQKPEFLTKLVDIAQVGRSLGIHLILATQKPSGLVDPQIWSNARFKVCLKVADKQDSQEMIGRPVAALVKNPGRAYIQVGYDETFEQIQSGYSGAEYVPQEAYADDESITVSMINSPGEHIREAKDKSTVKGTGYSQLECIMKSIVDVGKKTKMAVSPLWLQPLKHGLLLEEIDKEGNYRRGNVLLGLTDIPAIQKQVCFEYDFIQNGNLAVYGSSGTGKSTLLQTVAYNMGIHNSVGEFELFVLDYDGGSLISLSKMPHCVAYSTETDAERSFNILRTIETEITKRRTLFASKDCANYDSYLKAGGEVIPVVLVFLDNYASFREKMYTSEDLLVQLIASANACGIYFVITGNSKGAIYYKVGDYIKNRVVFNMNESSSYRDILNVPIPILPENVKGRALTLFEGNAVETQFAVPFDTENEAERVRKITEVYEKMPRGRRPFEVFDSEKKYKALQDEEDVTHAIYAKLPMKKLSCGSGILLGHDISSGERVCISVDECYRMFVLNKNNDVACVNKICASAAKGYDIKVYSRRYSELELKEDSCIRDISQYLVKENTSEEVLIIDGFSDFFDDISDEDLERLEELLSSNIIRVITFDDMTRIGRYQSTQLYLQLVKTIFGMAVGGNLSNEVATGLSTEAYSIPEEYRGVKLQDNEAFVYYKDMAACISLGGIE